MKIYLASSWKNLQQPVVLEHLRAAGHEVYDFRHPEPGNDGFAWDSVDPNWRKWGPKDYRKALNHKEARAGFYLDFHAMRGCDCCVMLMPCGRSAHLEAGYFVGAGKKLIIILPEGCEAELMYLMADHLCRDVDEALEFLGAK